MQNEKPYYCPYCNRHLLHVRGGPAERTKEHVIAQSVGGDGRWVIKTCRECNGTSSARCDGAFGKATDYYRFLGHRAVTRRGIITLLDGRQFAGQFEVQIHRNNTVQLHRCEPVGADPVRAAAVSHLTFPLMEEENPGTIFQTAGWKLALGGLYLTMSRLHKDSTERLFRGPDLHWLRLRASVARRPFVGRTGETAAAKLRALTRPEAIAWLGAAPGQSIPREHRMTVAGDGERIVISICVFSELFFEVILRLSHPIAPVPVVTLRQTLPSLMPAATDHLGNILLARPSPTICVVVTDRGQTVTPADQQLARAACKALVPGPMAKTARPQRHDYAATRT
jgi:hypothetical protein